MNLNPHAATPENIAALNEDIGLEVGYQTAAVQEEVSARMQLACRQIDVLMHDMDGRVNPNGMKLVKQGIRAEVENVLQRYFG